MGEEHERQNRRFRLALPVAGHLDLPGAWLAVLTWLYARKADGHLVLVAALADGSGFPEHWLGALLDDLRWLGVRWEEGPDVGGPFAPYRQDQRANRYREHLERLLRQGKAYRCYCAEERSEGGATSACSGECRTLTPEEEARRRAEEPSWRVRVKPTEAAGQALLEDLVIAEAGDRPTSLFRNAVDDGAMEIDCVVVTSSQEREGRSCCALTRLLGYRPPEYIVIPDLLPGKDWGASGQKGLDVRLLRDLGFLPQTVANYLAGLAGFPLEDLGTATTCAPSPPAEHGRRFFSQEELRKVNRLAIQAMEPQRFAEVSRSFLAEAGVVLEAAQLAAWLPLVKDRITLLSDLLSEAAVLRAEPDLTLRAVRTALRREAAQKVLWSFLRRLQVIEELTADEFREAMREVASETGLLGRELWDPIRLALVGKAQEPKIAEIAAILGKEECERRVRLALESIG
ncbi:MAG: glutamate--tRNA ligase family protein [candidate division KSB1 bacterium]|nr:glutamate--tRNA ligase family protein [candidate division KSB1 bacterium]